MRTRSKQVIKIEAKLGINEGDELWLPVVGVASMPRLNYPATPAKLGDISVVIDVKPPDAPERYHRLEAEELERRWREDPPVNFYKEFKLKAILLDDHEFENSDLLKIYVQAKVMNLLYIQIKQARRTLQDQGIVMQGHWNEILRIAFGGDESAIPQLKEG